MAYSISKTVIGYLRGKVADLSGNHPVWRDNVRLNRMDKRLTKYNEKLDTGESVQIRATDCVVLNKDPSVYENFNAESCSGLIASIASEGRNIVPVLVRRCAKGAVGPYELLIGNRRRSAVDWLNHNGRPEIRLSATIVDISDEEVFRLADMENRDREDISELTKAHKYKYALEQFYDGVQSRMSEALNVSNSNLSRLLALADLPPEVVAAFGREDEIRVRHSEVLTPLLRKEETRDRLIAEAVRINHEQETLAKQDDRLLAPALVLARLKDVGSSKKPIEEMLSLPIACNGMEIGNVQLTRDGTVNLEISIRSNVSTEDAFNAAKDSIRLLKTNGKV